MMTTRKLVIIFLTIIGLAFVFSNTRAAGNCTIKSATWDKSQAVVGEEVILSVSGNGCSGSNILFQTYEKRTGIFSDAYMSTISGNFTSDTFGFAKYKFTTSDYAKGSIAATENVYFKVMLESTVLDLESPILILSQGNSAGANNSCVISNAKWDQPTKDGPIVGTPLHLLTSGINCADQTASVEVWSKHSLKDYKLTSLSAKFDQSNKIDTVWKVDGTGDTDIVAGSYQLYFITTIGNSNAKSNTIQVPINSQSGCVNCNGGFAPDICQCADGTNINRPLAGSCAKEPYSDQATNLCLGHIGDALGGTGGGTTGGGGTGTGTIGGSGTGSGTQPKPTTIKFTITNPLGTNDIFVLLTKIGGFLFNLAIPVAVILITYSGFMFLTAAGNTSRIKTGTETLKWTVIGLAVLFIGKGFYTLILSILNLGKK